MKAKTFKTREDAEKELKHGDQYFVEAQPLPDFMKVKEVKTTKAKKVTKL